jgi:RNA polymerase sigma factor (sigma-70 family)
MQAILWFADAVQRSAGRARVVLVTATAAPETPITADAAPPSFDEVYAASYTDLAVQLYAYFGDRQEAQDVAQEAFCRALARWNTIARYDDPVAWIRRVAWNLAVSRWRRTRTALNFLRKQRQDEPRTEGPGPERVALIAALGTLPPAQRRAIVLHYLADLPVAEIARRERVTEVTVRSHLHRGRAALATQLKLESHGGAS